MMAGIANASLGINAGKLLGQQGPHRHRPRRWSCIRPMMVSVPQGPSPQSYWASVNVDIENNLRQALPTLPPPTVLEPMRRVVLSSPMTAAAALCVAVCELFGGRREDAMAAAAALQCTHAALFTHEHLPLTGRTDPAGVVDHVYSPNIELLTGDGVSPFGYEVLARSVDDPSGAAEKSDRILRVIVEISRAAGSEGMIDGRYREVEEGGGGDDVVGWAMRVGRKKEGELCACGAACGAILGGGNEEEVERLRRYGSYVGIIQGVLKRSRRKEAVELAHGFRDLALMELNGLKIGDQELEAFTTMVEATFF